MYTNKQIWNVSYPIFLSLLAQEYYAGELVAVDIVF